MPLVRKNKEQESSVKITEEMDTICSINNLPNEVIEKIFGYLKSEEICRAGIVCKRWRVISRSRTLWNRVDVRISRWSPRIARKFLQFLPSSLSHLKIDFYEARRKCIDFLGELLEKCPNLQTLIFRGADLVDYSNRKRIPLFEMLPADIKVFVLHSSVIYELLGRQEKYYKSKIKVLDVSHTGLPDIRYRETSMLLGMPLLKKFRAAGCTNVRDPFKKMHHIISQLEVLDLEDTSIDSIVFHKIRKYGFNLTELYVCNCEMLEDGALKIHSSTPVFPNLKTICVRRCSVTYDTVNSIIKSCPSLEHIYVGAGTERKSPVYDYTQCNSEKVHIIGGDTDCCHFQNVDYMLE